MKRILLLCCIALLLVMPVAAQDDYDDYDDDDIYIAGFELEHVAGLVSSIIAVILTVLTGIAYKRSQNKRLLFIILAFALFALRSAMLASEMFIEDIALFDPLSAFLDLAIMLIFFIGVLKK